MWLMMALMLNANAAPSASDVAQRHPLQPVVVAHRGASKAAPENTLAAYTAAINEGATVAETDVHLTADGQVVVMHDKHLDRTTDGQGPVRRQTMAAIGGLDAGAWFGVAHRGEPVPSLAQLLSLVRDKMVLCIEIKAAPSKGGEQIAGKIAALLDASGGRDQAIIFSFYPQQIMASKAAMPGVPALFLIQPSDGDIPYATGAITMARELGADMIGIDHRRTTPAFVAQAQAAGFPVFVYTADSAQSISKMNTAGVDGIISNLPGQTMRQLAEVKRSTR